MKSLRYSFAFPFIIGVLGVFLLSTTPIHSADPQITIQKVGNGQGTIVVDGDVCDESCTTLHVPHIENHSYDIHAAPAVGSIFAGWEMPEGTPISDLTYASPNSTIFARFKGQGAARAAAADDPAFPAVEAAYLAGEAPVFHYHRFWAQADIALANAEYARLIDQSPTPFECSFAVDYTISNQWTTGFVAEVTITNTSGSAIEGWELTWTFEGDETFGAGWNVDFSSSGQTVTASNPASHWNGTIGANSGTVTFGFQGTHSGNVVELGSEDFALNGITCGNGSGTPTPTPTTTLDPPLGALAANHGVYFGVAVEPQYLDIPEYTALVKEQFTGVVAENAMKWDSLEPSQGNFQFSNAWKIVNFGSANGMTVRGHTLLWHNQLPSWVKNINDANTLRNVMNTHITTVVQEFGGDVDVWDVVNEVIDDNTNLRDSVFSNLLGEQFIAEAFHMARNAADAVGAYHVKLYLNDYNIEPINAKSDATYALVQRLIANGVPINGIGFQSHFATQYGQPDYQSIRQNIQRFKNLGLEVEITEMDVRMPDNNRDYELQADIYKAIMEVALDYGCPGFTVWGLRDGDSWVPNAFPGQGVPLLFTDNYEPKPAAFAIHEALTE